MKKHYFMISIGIDFCQIVLFPSDRWLHISYKNELIHKRSMAVKPYYLDWENRLQFCRKILQWNLSSSKEWPEASFYCRYMNYIFQKISLDQSRNQEYVVHISRSMKFGSFIKLTLKVLVATIDAQWEGMGDVGSARYEPALLPPYPTVRVLSYSN